MNLKTYFPIVLLALGACSTLPSSGPTGSQVRKAIADPENTLGMQIVEVADASVLPPVTAVPTVSLPSLSPPPTDMVGPGDVLGISIYEAGVSLFGGNSTGDRVASFDPTVKVQTLPPARVDDDGNITVPYAGKLHVLGKTVAEIQAQIRNGMRGMSENPQILVNLRETINNSVIVSGEVARPGRLVLQTNRETLTDVIALAGGYRGNARDLTLRIMRHNQVVDVRFGELVDSPKLDVVAYPGDRVMLISNPQSFSVLGASGKVDQMAFMRSSISLAEAVASAGGVNPGLGDPAAIFLFRYVRDAEGREQPVVYHLNMMKAGSYFLAQRFTLQDKDVLYFGNASANQPSKMIQLVSQLFSPILTVTSAVQTVQNSNN